MNDPRLIVEGLTIEGPERVLARDVSFEARAGEVTGLTGPSGVGKSISVRAAMGMVEVQPGIVAGSVRYPGVVEGDLLAGVRGAGERGRRLLEARTRALRGHWVTLAPQAAASALNPGRTVGAQLARSLERRTEPTPPGFVRRLLAEVGLGSEVLELGPAALSGGMAQRVALAVALAPGPRVLIADEPETGLDPVLRQGLLTLLGRLGPQHGIATVLISHDPASVEALAHTVVRLEAARG